ncbi:hypothetical protein [Microcystis phage Mwe-JY05]
MTAVLDAARIVIAFGGLALAAFTVRMVWLSKTSGQRARFLGIALLLLVVSLARIEALGSPVTWHFFVALAADVALAVGYYSFARRETPSQRRVVDDPAPRGEPPTRRHGRGD